MRDICFFVPIKKYLSWSKMFDQNLNISKLVMIISSSLSIRININDVKMRKYLKVFTWSHLTRALSSSLVSITMVELRCSHTSRQKSASVSGSGPWVVNIIRLHIFVNQNAHWLSSLFLYGSISNQIYYFQLGKEVCIIF